MREHDLMFPEHPQFCGCYGGIVDAIHGERDAKPPRSRKASAKDLNASHLKPWQRRLPGETDDECRIRRIHCCYFCGEYDEDLAQLARHEDEAHYNHA